MDFLSLLIVVISGGYQLFALVAAMLEMVRRPLDQLDHFRPVSILKPVRGQEPRFRESLISHIEQDYPQFEILFGIGAPDDPAKAVIEDLMRQYPDREIRLLLCPTDAPNRKVGILEQLAAHARHPVLVVNDADIWVPPGYLRQITVPLSHPGIGLSTCLYRARAASTPAKWEALGIATDFIPSILVARLVSVSEFALGSTLAFDKTNLDHIGGFPALRAFLADDYQFGKALHRLGLQIHLSKAVVETAVGGTWTGVWAHQLRWARTIRLSRPSGYTGLIITNASVWALLLLILGHWGWAAVLLVLRMAVAVVVGWGILRSPIVWRWLPLVPLRDLIGFAIWVQGLWGNQVQWRGRRLTIDREGKIL